MGIKRKQWYYKKRQRINSALRKVRRAEIRKKEQEIDANLERYGLEADEKLRDWFFFGINGFKRYRRGLVSIIYNKSNCFLVFTDTKYKFIHGVSTGAFNPSFNKHDKTLFSNIKKLIKDVIRIMDLYKIKNVFLKIYNFRFYKSLSLGIFDLFYNAGISVRYAKFINPQAHNGVKLPQERRKKGHKRRKAKKKRRR